MISFMVIQCVLMVLSSSKTWAAPFDYTMAPQPIDHNTDHPGMMANIRKGVNDKLSQFKQGWNNYTGAMGEKVNSMKQHYSEEFEKAKNKLSGMKQQYSDGLSQYWSGNTRPQTSPDSGVQTTTSAPSWFSGWKTSVAEKVNLYSDTFKNYVNKAQTDYGSLGDVVHNVVTFVVDNPVSKALAGAAKHFAETCSAVLGNAMDSTWGKSTVPVEHENELKAIQNRYSEADYEGFGVDIPGGPGSFSAPGSRGFGFAVANRNLKNRG